jgi:hypothetical protein
MNWLAAADWLTDIVESAGEVLTFVPIVGAVIGLAAIVRNWYRRTIGRRRDRYRRLARLGTNAQLSFFESVLGEPPAIKRTRDEKIRQIVPREEYAISDWEAAPEIAEDGDFDLDPDEDDEDNGYVAVLVPTRFTECFFIDRDYYVQTVSDEDDTVLAFSITTRTKSFNPRFGGDEWLRRHERRRFKRLTGQHWQPFFRVRLGGTRFSELGLHDRSPNIRLNVGVRTYAYSEAYYLANPGNYQTVVFTASSAAVQGAIGPLYELAQMAPEGRWFGGPVASEDDERLVSDPTFVKLLERVRSETVVTTYTVLGPHRSAAQYPMSFGPHGDEVRTLR